MVQLSHLYTTTGKTIALTKEAYIVSLCFIIYLPSRCILVFLSRSKWLLATIHSDFGDQENISLILLSLLAFL